MTETLKVGCANARDFETRTVSRAGLPEIFNSLLVQRGGN